MHDFGRRAVAADAARGSSDLGLGAPAEEEGGDPCKYTGEQGGDEDIERSTDSVHQPVVSGHDDRKEDDHRVEEGKSANEGTVCQDEEDSRHDEGPGHMEARHGGVRILSEGVSVEGCEGNTLRHGVLKVEEMVIEHQAGRQARWGYRKHEVARERQDVGQEPDVADESEARAVTREDPDQDTERDQHMEQTIDVVGDGGYVGPRWEGADEVVAAVPEIGLGCRLKVEMERRLEGHQSMGIANSDGRIGQKKISSNDVLDQVQLPQNDDLQRKPQPITG